METQEQVDKLQQVRSLVELWKLASKDEIGVQIQAGNTNTNSNGERYNLPIGHVLKICLEGLAVTVESPGGITLNYFENPF